jgi:hypothetical protein
MRKTAKFNVAVTGISVIFSVGTMLYAVGHFGLKESWPELVLNLLYIACVVMMWMFFFDFRMSFKKFSYWCSICVGIAVLLRDILFPPPLAYYFVHLACLVLAVMLIILLTYFYARKEWKTFSKRNLWSICIVDMAIAWLYAITIYLQPVNDYTVFSLTEIWIRPTISYGMVLCFMMKNERDISED